MRGIRGKARCQYGTCTDAAQYALRFGDGTFVRGTQQEQQTLVYYCEPHSWKVACEFRTCDAVRLSENPRQPE